VTLNIQQRCSGTLHSQFSSLKPVVIKSVKSTHSSDGEAVIVGGRSFLALAAATGKTRSPRVVRPVDGLVGWLVGVEFNAPLDTV